MDKTILTPDEENADFQKLLEKMVDVIIQGLSIPASTLKTMSEAVK